MIAKDELMVSSPEDLAKEVANNALKTGEVKKDVVKKEVP